MNYDVNYDEQNKLPNSPRCIEHNAVPYEAEGAEPNEETLGEKIDALIELQSESLEELTAIRKWVGFFGCLILVALALGVFALIYALIVRH